jgi:hypothetical protein
VKDQSLTFPRRPRNRGAFVVDGDKKTIGRIGMTAGVPIFEPIGKIFLEQDLREIADALQRESQDLSLFATRKHG